MEELASIGIVIPYFGKLPDYFPLFLESVRYNSSIDWIFYTDDETISEYPDNVKVYRLSFEAFREKLQKTWDFPICIEGPYKLCDFKPTWGESLKEDLKGYDFWGCCDCDLIFGDIRKFITKEITDQYQRILTCGHLMLWRNVPEVNAYYREQKYIDYRMVLGQRENFVFDEERGIGGCWRKDKKPYWEELCYDDICVGMEDFHVTKSIPGAFIGPYLVGQKDETRRYQRMKHVIYSYHAGVLERRWIQHGKIHTEEVLYTHLQKRKMRVEDHLNYHAGFLIVPNRFTELRDLTVKEQKALAPRGRNLKQRLIIQYQIITCEMKFWGSSEWREKSVVRFKLAKYGRGTKG